MDRRKPQTASALPYLPEKRGLKEERYSKRIPMERIKEERYNLNIPCVLG
jgi:hypothetical protein